MKEYIYIDDVDNGSRVEIISITIQVKGKSWKDNTSIYKRKLNIRITEY